MFPTQHVRFRLKIALKLEVRLFNFFNEKALTAHSMEMENSIITLATGCDGLRL